MFLSCFSLLLTSLEPLALYIVLVNSATMLDSPVCTLTGRISNEKKRRTPSDGPLRCFLPFWWFCGGFGCFHGPQGTNSPTVATSFQCFLKVSEPEVHRCGEFALGSAKYRALPFRRSAPTTSWKEELK